MKIAKMFIAALVIAGMMAAAEGCKKDAAAPVKVTGATTFQKVTRGGNDSSGGDQPPIPPK